MRAFTHNFPPSRSLTPPKPPPAEPTTPWGETVSDALARVETDRACGRATTFDLTQATDLDATGLAVLVRAMRLNRHSPILRLREGSQAAATLGMLGIAHLFQMEARAFESKAERATDRALHPAGA